MTSTSGYYRVYISGTNTPVWSWTSAPDYLLVSAKVTTSGDSIVIAFKDEYSEGSNQIHISRFGTTGTEKWMTLLSCYEERSNCPTEIDFSMNMDRILITSMTNGGPANIWVLDGSGTIVKYIINLIDGQFNNTAMCLDGSAIYSLNDEGVNHKFRAWDSSGIASMADVNMTSSVWYITPRDNGRVLVRDSISIGSVNSGDTYQFLVYSSGNLVITKNIQSDGPNFSPQTVGTETSAEYYILASSYGV